MESWKPTKTQNSLEIQHVQCAFVSGKRFWNARMIWFKWIFLSQYEIIFGSYLTKYLFDSSSDPDNHTYFFFSSLLSNCIP